MVSADNSNLNSQLRYLKTLISTRWKQLLLVFLITAVPATIISLNRPVLYPVTSKLMFEQNRRVNIELSSQLSERASRSAIPPEKLNSQTEVIKGNYLIGKVVRTLGLAGEANSESSEVLRLQEKIGVRVIPASTIIEISYADTDPDRAQDIVNTLTTLFQEFYSKNVEGEDAMGFYEDRFQQTDYSLNENYRKLDALRSREGLETNYSQAKAKITDKVFSLKNQITDSGLKIAELEAKISFLKTVLANNAPQSKRDIEYWRNPNVNTLEDQLATLEMERNSLSTKYTESSREIRDKDEEIERLKERIRKSSKLVEGKVIHSINPLHEETEKQLILAMATLDGLKNSRGEMKAILASNRATLVRLNQLAYDFASIENAVAVDRKTHSYYLGKLQDARFIEAMREKRITSVSIIQKAKAPPLSKKPVFTSAAMSFGLGALISLAIVFLLDFLRPKLNSVEEIAQILRLPVIGTVTENGFREKS